MHYFQKKIINILLKLGACFFLVVKTIAWILEQAQYQPNQDYMAIAIQLAEQERRRDYDRLTGRSI